MATKGSLYIVATPIGNLSDITLRALEVLKSVDLILSENTSETQKLLDKFDIKTHQDSYREENRQQKIEKALEILNNGSDIALVSDSGTPLISDPGFKLVEALRKEEIRMIPIPGPSAVITALSASGLPSDNFTFLGFLPKSKNQRKDLLQSYGDTKATLIIYESPFRVVKLLNQIKKHLGNRYVCVASELTKIHEQIRTGYVDDILESNLKTKGEYVVLVAKEDYGPKN